MICSPAVFELRQVPADGSRRSIDGGVSWREWWDAAVLDFDARSGRPQGPFLQLWGWGEHAERFGARAERWILVEDGRPLGCAQVLVERSRVGMVAVVPHGPVCERVGGVAEALLAALRRTYRGRAVAVRFEPAWLDEPHARRVLAAANLRPAPPVQPRSTLVLDLRPLQPDGEASLLSEMSPKCRYNIGLASRRDVVVEAVGAEELDAFEGMMAATARRHDLTVRPAGYFRSAYAAFGPTGATLYRACFRDTRLAMIMVVTAGGRATYLYGASSEAERGRMPNHAIQWRAIVDARAAGCRIYDFWGVPDEVGRAVDAGADRQSIPEGEGGLWGVWRFKRGFGGRVERRVGRWDEPLDPVRYAFGVALPARIRAWRSRRAVRPEGGG